MPRPRVLIVEGDAVVADDLATHITAFGFDVAAVFPSGESVVERSAALGADLAVIDATLSGPVAGHLAGQQLTASLGVPVIYLAALAAEEEFARARDESPGSVVTKPFRPLELRLAIELALTRRSPPRPVSRGTTNARPTETSGVAGAGNPLAHLSLFRNVSRGNLDALLSTCAIHRVEAGAILVSAPDDTPDSLLVTSGRLSVGGASEPGHGFLTEIVYPGDPYGLFLPFAGRPDLVVRAECRGSVLMVPRAKLTDLLTADPALYMRFLSELTARYAESATFARRIAQEPLESRVEAALVALRRRLGASSRNAAEIPVTRREIAGLVGASIESVIRVTRAMERKGLIDLRRRGLIRMPADGDAGDEHRVAGGTRETGS